MNPEEISRSIPAVAKGATALGAMIPISDWAKRMLGPAADELAERWRDQVRLYRYEKQLNCVQKAVKMAQDAGFTPQSVPLKLLFPLLDGVSLEDNEDIHTMWAALLANASSPGSAEKTRPGYIAPLKQMAPDEAAVLKWIHRDELKRKGEWPDLIPGWTNAELQDVYGKLFPPKTSRPSAEFEICMSSLEAAALLEVRYVSRGTAKSPIKKFWLTDRGRAFITACTKPVSR